MLMQLEALMLVEYFIGLSSVDMPIQCIEARVHFPVLEPSATMMLVQGEGLHGDD